jgi:hypothetical protein
MGNLSSNSIPNKKYTTHFTNINKLQKSLIHMTENKILSGISPNETGFSVKKRGRVIRNRWNKMTTIDIIIRELEANPTKEKKTALLEGFKTELERYESGDFKNFRNTSIYGCFKYHYDFYSKQLMQE